MVALSTTSSTPPRATPRSTAAWRRTSTQEAFDTSVTADFKGNFDLVKLEEAILEAGPASVPYIVSTITCNSAGGSRSPLPT